MISNATLQWVPDHENLLIRWAGLLPPAAWLAVQVPGNGDAPSHRLMRAVMAEGPWRERLDGVAGPGDVPDAVSYAGMLAAVGCAVDAWETTYVHLLRAAGELHPVLAWLEGTALRPVRAALAEVDWTTFRRVLSDRLAKRYPVRDATVHFPFRRVFVVAQIRPPTPERDEG